MSGPRLYTRPKASTTFISHRLSFHIKTDNIANSQRILVSSAADTIVWQIQKICLMDTISQVFIKHKPQNVSRGWQIYLPDGLFLHPRVSISLQNLCSRGQLFDSSKATPIATWRVVDLLQLIRLRSEIDSNKSSSLQHACTVRCGNSAVATRRSDGPESTLLANAFNMPVCVN